MRPRISTSIFFIAVIIIVISHSSPALAQVKVLQCSPSQATVRNNLVVGVPNDPLNLGNLTVSGNTRVDGTTLLKNTATLENNAVIYKELYFGSNAPNPFISNFSGDLLFAARPQTGRFLFALDKDNNGTVDDDNNGVVNSSEEAMSLSTGGGLPSNNNFNLRVYGQVSPYQLHTMGIHLDMQGGIGPVPRPNILKITNAAATGTGAAIFLGDPRAYDNNSVIFSEYTAGQDIGKIMMTMNTASGNVGVATVNPQITLAVGDTDTGLRWNSDGNFSIYANNTERMNINAATNRISIIAPNELCLGGSCISSWPSSPTITLTGDVTGSGTTSIAATIPSGAVAWSELAGIPAGFADNTDDVGITSVPNCTAAQKLTGAGGVPVCANDIDTDTDAQTLSIAGNDISISGGNTITLPASTDNQTLSIAGNTLSISGGNSVVLPSSESHGKQRFTANGTFTVPAGVTKVWVSMSGGGGGGGDGNGSMAGGGGGADAVMAQEVIVTSGESIAVTIGTGGSGDAGGGDGATGGASLFGSYISTAGGGGGDGADAGDGYGGGKAGGPGGNRGIAGAYGGGGGSSIFGSGGSLSIINAGSVGVATFGYGNGYGGGGAGGTVNGGNGAPGFVLVEW